MTVRSDERTPGRDATVPTYSDLAGTVAVISGTRTGSCGDPQLPAGRADEPLVGWSVEEAAAFCEAHTSRELITSGRAHD
jgi:hypothetical protein